MKTICKKLLNRFKDTFPYIETDPGEEEYATIVIEDHYVPELLKALEKPDENRCLLEGFFAFLEELLQNSYSECNSLIQVTILESIGNDSAILCNALGFMGPLTIDLQNKAENSLGRKVNLKRIRDHADMM